MGIKAYNNVEDYASVIETYISEIEEYVTEIAKDIRKQVNAAERTFCKERETKAIFGRIETYMRDIHEDTNFIDKNTHEIKATITSVQSDIEKIKAAIEEMKATREAELQLLKDIQTRLWAARSREKMEKPPKVSRDHFTNASKMVLSTAMVSMIAMGWKS